MSIGTKAYAKFVIVMHIQAPYLGVVELGLHVKWLEHLVEERLQAEARFLHASGTLTTIAVNKTQN